MSKFNPEKCYDHLKNITKSYYKILERLNQKYASNQDLFDKIREFNSSLNILTNKQPNIISIEDLINYHFHLYGELQAEVEERLEEKKEEYIQKLKKDLDQEYKEKLKKELDEVKKGLKENNETIKKEILKDIDSKLYKLCSPESYQIITKELNLTNIK